MLLQEKFRQNFTPEDVAKGQTLLSHCTITRGSLYGITAEVMDGDALYEPQWSVENHRLKPYCDCETFGATHRPCAHLYAALLVADGHTNSFELHEALKKNVPRATLTVVNDSPEASRDAVYQPESTRKSSQTSADSAPRYSSLRRRKPVPRAVADENPDIEILYIIPVDQQQPDDVVLDLAWRPLTLPNTVPAGAKRLIITDDAPLPSRAVAKILSWGNAPQPSRLTFPAAKLPDFLEILDEHNLLRWNSTADRRLHAVTSIIQPGICFQPAITTTADAQYLFSGVFELPTQSLPLQQCLCLWAKGYVLSTAAIFPADLRGHADLIRSLLATPGRIFSAPALNHIICDLVTSGQFSADEFPPSLRPSVSTGAPRGRLYVRTARYKFKGHEQLHADLQFDYDGNTIDYNSAMPAIANERMHSVTLRNELDENTLILQLQQLGFRWNDDKTTEEPGWKLSPSLLENAVLTLVNEDWTVTAEGKTYRKPTTKTIAVVSHIDWFELEGNVTFDGFTVPLPELIKAQQDGARAVRLDDGTYGILPVEWLAHFTALTEIGQVADDTIQFRQKQAAIVAALLEDIHTDFIEKLKTVPTADVVIPPLPETFRATLRPYQQTGREWLVTMAGRGLGACLADDMGLGKTVQILSLLATRRAVAGVSKPSLVVMPKSLIFNWQEETQRFAPQLTTLIYTGAERHRNRRFIPQTDIVFTTYGTLRNDAVELAKIHFDCCILDESQAIKNMDSSTAEAARVIQADFRVAMTGTPIENKLAELFSQLEFTNPGLFGNLLGSAVSGKLSANDMRRIRDAVKPFILRRTKAMVAANLPPKTEQVLWCELDEQHQAEYNALRDTYRKQLLEEDDSQPNSGPAASTMDTLAALLRLRQAACHPALVFENRHNDISAKLDTLLETVQPLLEDNHKILIFSQFTKFLKLAVERFEEAAIRYAYLDGSTENRQEVVRNFQTDDTVSVFFISLKAGGVGLNLTAADYIFILDPWWNPATEAQAIDRAYRIGQTRPVFAYKLITRNTIEEKVLQMQQSKKKLADAILENSLTPSALSQDDLRFLLS